MAAGSSFYASQLRRALAERNRLYARGVPHVESYGSDPVIIYAPAETCHGNFFSPAYRAILSNSAWHKRFAKIHTQGRSLPSNADDPGRKWRELDSCMSSDALLMNVFCTPSVTASPAVRRMLGVDAEVLPDFGWKARVPLQSGRLDRTEVDMRWGDLLMEAKLTESDFQTRAASIVHSYRDIDAVFDRERLPRVAIRIARRRQAVEFPEEFTQEWEPVAENSDLAETFQQEIVARTVRPSDVEPGYASYQLIRNVLAAEATGNRFCVLIDERRPDLLEAWFQVMAAVRSADLRTRLTVLTWQELAFVLPPQLQEFLFTKYGIGTANLSGLDSARG